MDPLEFTYKRQFIDNNSTDPNSNDGFGGGWWWSPEAYAIKWAVIGSIVVLLFAFLLGGYLHARKRMKKGQAPLKYHRWLIPQHQRNAFYAANPHLPNPYPSPRYNLYTPAVGQHAAPAYAMGAYAPPPPAYGQHEDYVPPYPGKTNPDQRPMNVQVQETGVANEAGAAARGEGGMSSTQAHPGGDLGARQVETR